MSPSRGLAAGTVGTASGAVLGVASVAPGYTLTANPEFFRGQTLPRSTPDTRQ
ncbi:hypothetical protein [Mycobacterium sp. HUMS_1102779]|uniref:hypothetical protein n=1 Tax=Mycobacterium sp. HUMS_1102779 TaxID=3383487 RepID=UPI00389A3E22